MKADSSVRAGEEGRTSGGALPVPLAALLGRAPSPCHVIDLAALERNLAILAGVRSASGARVLLALKACACFHVFPLVRRFLDGVAASSPDEARLGAEAFGGSVHVYAPAYRADDFPSILLLADHVVFNSVRQWERFQPLAAAAGRPVSCGLRVNPGHSEVRTAIYDPCARYSRLGVTAAELAGRALPGLEGLHFHTLCELGADALERTLAVFEKRFADRLPGLAWVNFGGGHHITRPGYDTGALCRLIGDFRSRWGTEVFLEPGEAVFLDAGYLVATVLDIVRNEMETAILDTSAAAHMPDVIEMPYRPAVFGAGGPGEHRHRYRLAGLTCLAGDVIGDYSFPEPLREGDRLVFQDMAHYTMVKNNTFNGVRLPTIALADPRAGTLTVAREFGYEDYRARQG